MDTPHALGTPMNTSHVSSLSMDTSHMSDTAVRTANAAHALEPNLSADRIERQSRRVRGREDPVCGLLAAGRILRRLDRRLALRVSDGRHKDQHAPEGYLCRFPHHLLPFTVAYGCGAMSLVGASVCPILRSAQANAPGRKHRHPNLYLCRSH